MSVHDSGTVLVVRHGPGRGRLRDYMRHVLDFLAQDRQLQERVRFHQTGTPAPSLAGIVTVVFWLADPLREWYPACYVEAVEIAERARAHGIHLVNEPESLSNSVKSRQSRLWQDAGFDTPTWIRFEDLDELQAAIERIGTWPILIRSDEAHGQHRIQVATDKNTASTWSRHNLETPGAVAPLIDVRGGSMDRGLYARFHHKKRLYVLGNRTRTEHIFFSKHPVVSAETCTFARYRGFTRTRMNLARLSPTERHIIREDLAYWRRGEDHHDLMVRAVAALGFGFAAIDYSQRADGGVVLWEANPYPLVPTLKTIRLPRLRCANERYASYCRAIGDFLLHAAVIEPGRDHARSG